MDMNERIAHHLTAAIEALGQADPASNNTDIRRLHIQRAQAHTQLAQTLTNITINQLSFPNGGVQLP